MSSHAFIGLKIIKKSKQFFQDKTDMENILGKKIATYTLS